MDHGNGEEEIDLTGEVTMVCVSQPRMAIRLADGREIEAPFRAEDEETVTTALKEHKTSKLRVIGRGTLGADGQVREVVYVIAVLCSGSGEKALDSPAKPIWEKFAEMASEIPEEALQRLPTDGAARLDDYLYGNVEDD